MYQLIQHKSVFTIHHVAALNSSQTQVFQTEYWHFKSIASVNISGLLHASLKSYLTKMFFISAARSRKELKWNNAGAAEASRERTGLSLQCVW